MKTIHKKRSDINFNLIKNNLIISCLVFTFIIFSTISLVNAELNINAPVMAAPDYTFKVGEDANLIASCDIDGVPCDPATGACNLTIRDPNDDYVINFQPMTLKFGGDINYTILTNQITQIGDYTGKINCMDGGQNKTATFILAITPTGKDTGYGLFLILAISSIAVLALGMFAQNEYVGFLAGALFIITGVYSLAYGIGNLADLYTRAMGFVSLGLGLIFMIAAGYKVVEGILGEDKGF